MEEAANRKLRLKAMRKEAAEVGASSNIDSPMVSTHLCNPLVESSVQESAPVAARFDYYTDPMAGYSGNKRKTQKTRDDPPNCFFPPTTNPPRGPGNINMTQSPCQQYNQTQIHSSDQGMYRSPMPYNNSAPWGSPIVPGGQFAQQRGPPPVMNRPGDPPMYGIPPDSPMVGPYPPMLGGNPSPGFGHNSPMCGGNPSPGFGPNPPILGGNPSPGFGWGGSPNPYEYQLNNTPNRGFGRGASPNPRGNSHHNSGRGGRGQYNNSPNFVHARGGGPSPSGGRNSGPRHNNNGRGRGHGRGRGWGFHESASARDRPDLFYDKSMVEDPWKYLEPIVREVHSWLPKSIRKEKASEVKVTSGSTRSGLSFAESLAASYEEAAALATAYEKTPDDLNNV